MYYILLFNNEIFMIIKERGDKIPFMLQFEASRQV